MVQQLQVDQSLLIIDPSRSHSETPNHWDSSRRVISPTQGPRPDKTQHSQQTGIHARWDVAGSIPAGVSGFFIDIKSLRSHYGPGVDSTSNRNEYQEHFLGVKAAGAQG